MPKDKVSEWSSTPSNNTDIGGINIAEGCAPSGINNAIRELMAQVKDMQAGSDGDGLVVGGTFTSSGAAVFSSTVALGSAATATTPSSSDDSTKVATTAFVKDVALPDTSGNGIVTRTGALTVTNRTITAGTGITVTNGDGVSGNPTIANSGVTSINTETGSLTFGICRAWVNFTGIGTISIRSSFNVSSITDNGVGDYTLNFTNDLVDANYSVIGSVSGNYSVRPGGFIGVATTRSSTESAPTTSSIRFITMDGSNSFIDPKYVNVAIIR